MKVTTMTPILAVFIALFIVRDTIQAQFALSTKDDDSYFSLDEAYVPGADFWDDVRHNARKDRSVGDRFGPLSQERWIRRENALGYGIWTKRMEKGRGAIMNMTKNAFLDTIADRVPTEEWLGNFSRSRFSQFFVRLVRGSVGNSEEQDLEYVSASPSQNSIDETAEMLASIRTDRIWDYGVKPWYAYVMADVGKDSDGKPLFHFDMRGAMRVSAMDESGVARLLRIESQIIIPIYRDFTLTIGSMFYPGEITDAIDENYRDYSPSGSIRLQHTIEWPNAEGLFYIGCKTGPHETLVSSGLWLCF